MFDRAGICLEFWPAEADNSSANLVNSPTSKSKQRLLKGGKVAALLVLGLGFAAFLTNPSFAARLKGFADQAREMGWRGDCAFILVYAVAAACLVPASALTLAAGAVFGFVHGFILVSAGSTLGAAAAFLFGRFLVRDWVSRRISAFPRFAAVYSAVGEEGWRVVALLRLSPLVPYGLLNYALGVTRVAFAEYLLASWLGMIPGTALYVYIGSIASVRTESKSPLEWLLYGVGGLATVGVLC